MGWLDGPGLQRKLWLLSARCQHGQPGGAQWRANVRPGSSRKPARPRMSVVPQILARRVVPSVTVVGALTTSARVFLRRSGVENSFKCAMRGCIGGFFGADISSAYF